MYNPTWIKPSFYKFEKLLFCELDIKTLTDGGDELWTSILLGSSYVRFVTVLNLIYCCLFKTCNYCKDNINLNHTLINSVVAHLEVLFFFVRF